MSINFVEIFGAFFVMAAIIDILGSIPIFVSMKAQNKVIKAGQACLVALALFKEIKAIIAKNDNKNLLISPKITF